MQGKQGIKTSTIVKRAVLITALLAVVEIVVIYFYKSGENKKAVVTNTIKEKPVQITAEPPKDTVQKHPTEVVKVQPPQAAVVKDSIKPVKADTPKAIVKAPLEINPIVKDTKVKPTPKAALKPVEKPAPKELTEQEMAGILNDINAEKSRLNKQTNCVQLRQTSSSNVVNGFKIASFLKSKGFIISGRETTSTNQNGVHIDASGSCIKLTIGSM